MKKILPRWQITVQISILSFLLVLVFLPHVKAQISTPSTIPTSVEGLSSSLPTLPSSSDLLDQGQGALEQRAGALLQERDIPRTLSQTLENNGPATRDNAQAFARDRLQGEIADTLPNANSEQLAQGNISSLVASNGQSAQDLAQLSTQIQARQTDLTNQRIVATNQALGITGLRALADCSTSNDNGKDLCKAIEDLKQEVSNTDETVQRALRAANRIKTFVSNKPAFLNTPSITTPVCLGLLTDIPGTTDQLPDIAANLPAYNDAANLVSVAAVRAQLVNPGNSSTPTGSASTQSTDPLTASLNASNTGASNYMNTVQLMQTNYDRLYLLALSNFGDTLQARFDLLKTHADELDQIVNVLESVGQALNTRPQTP